MKQLKKSDVLRVALHLMKINGKTTTLEVKEKLRDQDFDVYQNEVSEYMRELSTQYCWKPEEVPIPPKHRVYSCPNYPPQIVIWWIQYKKIIYRFGFIFLSIANALLVLYMGFKTYQWFQHPDNNKLEPYLALIAQILSILQVLIVKFDPKEQ